MRARLSQSDGISSRSSSPRRNLSPVNVEGFLSLRSFHSAFLDFSLLHGAARSLSWISRRDPVRLSCISRRFFATPFVLFTIPDFLTLHSASLPHFAIPIRYNVRPVHYSGFFGAVQFVSTYFWTQARTKAGVIVYLRFFATVRSCLTGPGFGRRTRLQTFCANRLHTRRSFCIIALLRWRRGRPRCAMPHEDIAGILGQGDVDDAVACRTPHSRLSGPRF